jgi:hypothetical protein
LDTKQIYAILAPFVLIAVVYTIFQLLARILGRKNWRLAWYLGLAIYWLIWGAVFPCLMIGKDSIIRISQPQPLTVKIFFLVLFPIAMSALYKLIPKMKYEKNKYVDIRCGTLSLTG